MYQLIHFFDFFWIISFTFELINVFPEYSPAMHDFFFLRDSLTFWIQLLSVIKTIKCSFKIFPNSKIIFYFTILRFYFPQIIIYSFKFCSIPILKANYFKFEVCKYFLYSSCVEKISKVLWHSVVQQYVRQLICVWK